MKKYTKQECEQLAKDALKADPTTDMVVVHDDGTVQNGDQFNADKANYEGDMHTFTREILEPKPAKKAKADHDGDDEQKKAEAAAKKEAEAKAKAEAKEKAKAEAAAKKEAEKSKK